MKVAIPTFNSIDNILNAIEGVGKTVVLARKLFLSFRSEGIYEVLDYEASLRIHDKKGRKAKVHKREVVKYLQDGVVAVLDQAWGDGTILINYRTSPGHEVDRYRRGHKTNIVISLRKARNKGNIDEHIFEWEMHNGFRKKQGMWSTDISHRTKKVKVIIIFPKSRPPQRARIIESNLNRRTDLDLRKMQQMPTGSWKLLWEKQSPRLYETYILDWDW